MLAANLFPMFATSVHDSFCLQFGHKCWCQCLRLPSPLYSHLFVIRIICHYCFAWRYINCWWAIEKPMWLQNHLSKPTSMRYKYYGVLVRQNAKTHLQPQSSFRVFASSSCRVCKIKDKKMKPWDGTQCAPQASLASPPTVAHELHQIHTCTHTHKKLWNIRCNQSTNAVEEKQPSTYSEMWSNILLNTASI
jgi:hypothetical protein